MKQFTLTILVANIATVLVLASAELLLPYLNLSNPGEQPQKSDFHVGVSFGGKTTTGTKLLTYPRSPIHERSLPDDHSISGEYKPTQKNITSFSARTK